MPQAVAAAAVWIGNTVGSAVGAVLTAAGVSASVALPIAATVANAAYFVSELAIYTGLNYVVDDIAHQKPAPMGQELRLQIAADVPREMLIGIRATGGSMVARYSRGANLYNAHFAIQLADHPCAELSKVYGDGRIVRDTPLTHGTRTEITAYSYSGGARVWMTWHDGRPGQAVDSDLVSKSALDPDVVSGQIAGWSSTHRGAGCAWVHVEVQWDSDILTSIPEFLFLVKGAAFYDRRLDTTAGGSGSHRLNDPSTWAYTTNAGVVLDHYLLGYKVEDDDLAFGVGLEPDEVPYSTFAALADLCDEDVTTGTGGAVEVIKRYAVNGLISSAQTFEDVLESLQIQMAARIVDLGGRIGILGAEERTSVVSLTDDDWASDESVRFSDKLQFSDLYGAISGRFTDPANLYQPTPYDRQTTAYFLLPDGGEATTAQVDMPLEVHPRRAARLASAWLSRESLQPRLVGTFATRSLAWKLEPGDWFTMSSDFYQFTNELFEVVDVVKHEDFTVTVTARAIDPAFLAFSVDDDPDLSVPPAVDPYSLLLDEPTFDVVASSLTAGGVVEPTIEFTLTSDETVAREIVVEVSKWDGAALVAPSLPFTFHAEQIVSQIRAGIQPSTSYKVRAKTRAGLRESPWTDWSAVVTTGATYSVGSAASVPWTGVTDDNGHRPDPDADVTAANTAAAITGQGALATLNAVGQAQLLAAFGRNRLIDSLFYFDATYWTVFTGSGSSSASTAVANGIRYRQAVGSGLTVGSYIEISTDVGDQKLSCPVEAGDRIEVSCYFGRVNTSNVTLYVYWFDEAATFKGLSSIQASAATSAGAGDITSYTRLQGFATAPTGARRAVLALQATASTSAPTLRMAYPFIARAGSAQTEATPWNPGRESQVAADVTSVNIAAGIAGQAPAATDTTIQAGATKNTLTFAASAPSGPTDGDIWVDTSSTPYVIKTRVSGAWQASGSYGGIFGSTLYETGGGAVASLANFKTILGTAAGFTGQGPLATSALTDLLVRNEAINNSVSPDPNFMDPTSYKNSSPGSADSNFSRVSVDSPGGPYALQAAASPNLIWYPSANRKFVFDRTRVYEASFWRKRLGGDRRFYALMQFFDKDGVRIDGASLTGWPAGSYPAGGNYYFDASYPPSSSWERVSVVFGAAGATVPTNAVYAMVGFLFGYDGTTDGNVQCTGIRCEELRRIGTNLYRADGSLATEAAIVTSLGVSSGFTGQGTQATANHQRGTSYSGTPVEGSWWADTSTSQLKLYTGGAWNVVASIGASAISATASPTSINEVHSGSSFSSGTITITPSGGTSYTYAVTFVKSGGAGNVSFDSTNSASFTATSSLSSGQDVAGAIIVQVFDSGGKLPFTLRIPLNFSRTD